MILLEFYTTGWCTVEIKDYVIFQNPQEQSYRLPPPRTLILDFTLTHTFGRSYVYSTRQLTHTRSSDGDGVPEPDGDLRTMVRKTILHYRQLYINRPDPVAFIPGSTNYTFLSDVRLFLSLKRTCIDTVRSHLKIETKLIDEKFT